MKRKLLAMLLAAAMVFVMLPTTVAAAGTYHVDTADELKTALSEAGAAGAGNTTIEIEADLDLSSITWTPISVDGYHGADIVTVNGNNHTITGLSAPLFRGGFAGGSGIVINDLTIADSNIVSSNTQGSGAFVECADSMDVITLKNCHLLNSKVTGSRTGGLVGWTSGYSNEDDGPVKSYITFEDCSVIGCEITGEGSVGGLNGHAGASDWTYTLIKNCTVANNKLTAYDDGDYRVGILIGTANVGVVTVEGTITASGNEVKQYTDSSCSTEVPCPEDNNGLFGRQVLGTTGSCTAPDTITVAPYEEEKEIEKSVPNFFLFMFMKRLLTEYEITVETEGNGIVESDDDDNFIRFSHDVTFTAVPDEGSELTSILLDGEEVALPADDEYTIERVRKAHTITFVFSEIEQEPAE